MQGQTFNQANKAGWIGRIRGVAGLFETQGPTPVIGDLQAIKQKAVAGLAQKTHPVLKR